MFLQAAIKNSVWVPMYDVDKNFDPGTLLKKLTSFTMGELRAALTHLVSSNLLITSPPLYCILSSCFRSLTAFRVFWDRWMVEW